jgi:uncharacterized hydrophobic protein (TIGR00271 family)
MEGYGEAVRRFRTSLLLTEEEQREAQESITSNAQLSFEYILFIVLSAVVATLGLITNSAPVIIGAMVLAPLMSPVLGISLGVVRGEFPLLARGLKTLTVGLIIGFFIAAISAWIIPEFLLTAEIKGRTNPTLYDLFIGMAAGAGGAMGQARRSVAGVLPGAAIAVSLMPPLCVTGIAFALQLGAAPLTEASALSMMYGSALLWIANLAAINLAAISVFVMLGFRKLRQHEEARHFRRSFTFSAVLVGLLVFPLVAFLQKTVEQTRDEKSAKQTLVRFAHDILDEEAELVSFRVTNVDPRKGWRYVVATISSPRLPDRIEALDLREELEVHLGKIELRLTINPVHTYRENPEEGSISERPKRRQTTEDNE